MSESISSAVVPVDRCANCGYSLRGLPAWTLCPECGRVQDRDEIVLWGWSPRSRLKRRPARRRWWVAAGVFLLLSITYIMGMVVFGPEGAAGPALGCMIYGLCPLLILAWLKFGPIAGEPQTHVHLCPEGFGIRSRPGLVTIKRWTPRVEMALHSRKDGLWVLELEKYALVPEAPVTRLRIAFECTPERAGLIRQQIDTWRRQSEK